jgi:hypothetical protein
MKKEFSLEHGGPKRIRVTWAGQLKNTEVFFDGTKIASFATANEFGRGTTVKLADGSLLTVRWRPLAGIPILKGVHLVRNGLPIPGSAADPLPAWAWPFIIACALIPVVTLGGALPALIGFGGASGTMTISRFNKLSRTVRVGACATVTLFCWTAFALLIYSVQKTSASLVGGGARVRNAPASVVAPGGSEPPLRGGPRNPLLSDIEQTYRDKGFREDYIKESVDQFDERCRRMNEEKCDIWLQATLQNIREHAISNDSAR